ncbi:MAG: flavodoxin family protein [Armatimonadota bacterium]
MKILGIVGSPKGPKSATRKLVGAVLDGARAAGAEVELVDLSKLSIDYCHACGACYVKGECPHQDDFPPLLKKMMSSDGLVWGSPDYFRSVSGQMKTMLDRMADAMHCQAFLGKYACAVSTSGSRDYPEVTDYLGDLLVRFGASVVGSIGAPGMAVDEVVEEATSLGGALVDAIRTQRVFPEQEPMHAAMLERFKFLINMNKDTWTHEYNYWQNMGWL